MIQHPLFQYTPSEHLAILGSIVVGGGDEWRRLVELGGLGLACERAYERAAELRRAEEQLKRAREKARARAFVRRARARAAEEGGEHGAVD